MVFYNVPIGFGLALSANTAAMNRYAQLTEAQKQDILNKAHKVRSEKRCTLWWKILPMVQYNK